MLETLEKIKENKPMIHCITNYVTINDVANVILAIGGKPIMAECKDEVDEITAVSSGLNLNMGMLNKDKVEAMIVAGKSANKNHIPVVLDPVGCGGSRLRKESIQRLLHEVHFSVIKGNISELKTIYDFNNTTSGVEVKKEDLTLSKESIKDMLTTLAKRYHCIIVASGKEDYVCDESKAYIVYNGHEMMSLFSGSGCCLTGILTTYMSVRRSIDSALEAVIVNGLAGEKAYNLLKENEGSGSYKIHYIDSLYRMNKDIIEEGARYESI